MANNHAQPPPPFVADPSGTRYETGPCMGKGGFAICHAAERYEGERPTGHLVALKIVKTHIKPEKLAQKFVTELQIHSKLSHPNIVKFYRAFTVQQSTFVVLELCANNSLADLLRRRKTLTLPEVRRIVIQLCGAAKYLHERHIVHRDLKTGNIFLDDKMNIKIGDFGLAALLVTSNDMAVQRRTTMCGTPNYLAPEILEKENGHDERVDLWAIGIIIYTLAVGTAPFHATTKEMIYKNLRNGAYTWPELTSSNNQSADLRDLVSRMLVPEQDRLVPDQIVSHNFFKIAFVPGRIPESALDKPPVWPDVSIPSAQDVRRGYSETWFALCRDSGVGEYETGKFFRIKHGGRRVRSVVHDMAKEAQSGTQPVLPLPSFTIYRSPICDWEQETQSVAGSSQGERLPRNRTLLEISHNARSRIKKTATTGNKAQEDVKLMPPPPLPSTAVERFSKAGSTRRAARTISEETAKSANSLKISLDQPVPELSVPKTRNPPQVGAGILQQANSASSKAHESKDQNYFDARDVVKPSRSSTIKRSADPTLARRPRALDKAQQRSTSPDINHMSAAGAKRSSPNKRTKQKHAEEFVILADPELEPSSKPSRGHTQPRRLNEASDPSVEDARPSHRRAHSSVQREKIVQHLPNACEPQPLYKSEPSSMQQGLCAFRDNLDASLKHEIYGRSSPALAQGLPFVTRWVDYHQKHGFGYALADGTVGCIINRVGQFHPVTHVVVRDGRKWLAHIGSKFEGVEDVPFEIYEDCGEAGLRRKIYKGTDCVESGPLLAADERRHELGVLWFKFGRYMSQHLDGDERETDEPGTDFVRLYQRIGAVNVYYLTNGCMQFQFPDHTKLVINATGTHMSALCITPEAADYLETCGELLPQHYGSRELFADSIVAMLNDKNSLPPGFCEANDLYMKLKFIRDVVTDWLELKGLGCTRQERIWDGQSTAEGRQQCQKVTVGRYGGD